MRARALMLAVLSCVLITGCNGCPFIKMHSHPKHGECKFNLKTIFVAQRDYFAQHGRYSESVADLPFLPERNNRYAYFLAMGDLMSDRSRSPEVTPMGATAVGADVYARGAEAAVSHSQLPSRFAGGVTAGVRGECPKCEFVAVCAGNIDNDTTLDVWSIASFDRVADGGEPVPRGIPFHEQDDGVLP